MSGYSNYKYAHVPVQEPDTIILVATVVSILSADPILLKNWTKLSTELDVSQSVTTDLSNSHVGTEAAINTLVTSWVSRNGRNATIESLVGMLNNLGFKRCAHSLEDNFGLNCKIAFNFPINTQPVMVTSYTSEMDIDAITIGFSNTTTKTANELQPLSPMDTIVFKNVKDYKMDNEVVTRYIKSHKLPLTIIDTRRIGKRNKPNIFKGKKVAPSPIGVRVKTKFKETQIEVIKAAIETLNKSQEVKQAGISVQIFEPINKNKNHFAEVNPQTCCKNIDKGWNGKKATSKNTEKLFENSNIPISSQEQFKIVEKPASWWTSTTTFLRKTSGKMIRSTGNYLANCVDPNQSVM